MSEHFALTKRQKQIKAITLLAAISAISDQMDQGNQIESIDTDMAKDIEQTINSMEVFLEDFDGTPESMNNTPEGAAFMKECLSVCLAGIKDAIS